MTRVSPTRQLEAPTVGELAAGLAHELNNPLFGILGLVEFLLRDSEPGSRNEERLLLVQQSAREMKQIIGSLVEFARDPADGARTLEEGT